MPKPTSVECPRCGTPVPWTAQSPYRPFCSERCKLVDLGAWASESYRVPCDPENDEAQETEPKPARD